LDEVQGAALELQREKTSWKYLHWLKQLNIFNKWTLLEVSALTVPQISPRRPKSHPRYFNTTSSLLKFY
jgi:hypothetical protein